MHQHLLTICICAYSSSFGDRIKNASEWQQVAIRIFLVATPFFLYIYYLYQSVADVALFQENLPNNLFRSYFMIINERNNIAEYSIICMFRKCFVNIVPFSEIIFVLLQAYLLIRNRERYITSLVAAGYLQMTNPDNPTASNQKYKKVNKR